MKLFSFRGIASVLSLCWCGVAWAQVQPRCELWQGWFVQAGLDMSLQNPYGHNFQHVFPNGKSFGVDVAVGKWFSPVVGLRARANWENGLDCFKNNHDNWLAPFNEPGANRKAGGYVMAVGDVLLDVHGLFGGADASRLWQLTVYPTAGMAYNFGVKKGTPLLGAGVLNTWRVGERWKVYADASYNMVSSGFVGVEKSTGTGSNNNGFFNLGVGAQYDLGDVGAFRVSRDVPANAYWFVQAGADMTLINPYGANFANVLPKGATVGVDVAVGRWFTPVFALRVRGKMENNLVKNDRFEWMGPLDENGKSTNFDGGGFMVLCGDVLLSVPNLFVGEVPDRAWDVQGIARAGLLSNRASSSGSPLVGMGLGGSYWLGQHWGLYGAVVYQVSTSESFEANSGTGMTVSSGSNGFFDVEVGVAWRFASLRSSEK